MIDDINFANSFRFTLFSFKKYKYTDNSRGINTHYLAYMVSGRARIVTESTTLTVSEGDVFYIPKNLKYESFWYGDPSIEFISLGFSLFPAFHKESYSIQRIDATDGQKEKIRSFAEPSVRSAEKVGALYSLLAEFMPIMRRADASKSPELVIRVKKYISTHPKHTVRQIAKAFAMSESGLYSLFKKHSDLSINDYRERCIMRAASERLISSDTPIEQISESLGFSSSSYFRKRFKSHFGISPRDYRKKEGV